MRRNSSRRYRRAALIRTVVSSTMPANAPTLLARADEVIE
jgi:hypothetical protein